MRKARPFGLLIVVTERLSQHFYGKKVESLNDALRDSSGATQATEEAAVLVDTLIILQNLTTHLAAQMDC